MADTWTHPLWGLLTRADVRNQMGILEAKRKEGERLRLERVSRNEAEYKALLGRNWVFTFNEGCKGVKQGETVGHTFHPAPYHRET